MTKASSDKLIEIPRPPVTERAVLARLALPQDSDAEVEESLDELRQLAWTAGADAVLTVVQRREAQHPATLFGPGKVEEIKAAVAERRAEVLILDSECTATQGGKLEEAVGCKVVDRTQLILDIFAQRAHTREAKHQVELAQLQYLLPRLTGRGSIMRQQGGIGVRGPGEQKLEVDRRVIRDRISRLKHELEVVRAQRRVQRKKRASQASGQVALVGYTNAGKSSLLNALTHADVLAENKLFATLDPRVRQCALPGGRTVVLADTVGFIRRLPHLLVAAFRATLEEVNESDLLVHVVDASHPAMEDHMRAVDEVLEEIKAAEIPVIKAYNKCDRLEPGRIAALRADRDPAVAVSALTGEGLGGLLDAIDRRLAAGGVRVRLRVPSAESALIARLYEEGRVLSRGYDGSDVLIEAEVARPLLDLVEAYR